MANAERELTPQALERAHGRVLLVDDQPDVRRIFERSLSKAGHDVVIAESGQEALLLASESRFDVVVSDVQMPDMNGVELLRELHERDADLPVVLVSGAPDFQTAMKAVEHGALEYLTKPVELEKLRGSVTRGIVQRRERAEAKALVDQFRSGTRRRPNVDATENRASWTGELLAGRYRVGKLLGAGGMGAVYEGTREDLGQMRVALKVLHESLADDRALLARFEREAQTVGAINHPNIVRLHDFHADEAGPIFLVTELLDGVSLREAMKRHSAMTNQRVVFIASQILAALAAVHRARVIHRDIKPENVFLTSVSGLGDIVKLLDFGVAKVLGVAPGETLTQVGTVLGTPTYMAPEQARGATMDLRSDLYSVATIMYECLTGQVPFVGDNYNALLYAIQQGKPTPLEELRPDLEPEFVAVVRRGMAVEPDARFQSAEEMADALRAWLNVDSGSHAPPESSAMVFAPTIVPISEKPTRPAG